MAALGNDKTALEAQIAQLTSDLQARTQELEQRGAAGSSPTAEPASDQQAQLAEQQTLIAKLQSDLDSSRSQLSALTKKEQDLARQRMRHGLEVGFLLSTPPGISSS